MMSLIVSALKSALMREWRLIAKFVLPPKNFIAVFKSVHCLSTFAEEESKPQSRLHIFQLPVR